MQTTFQVTESVVLENYSVYILTTAVIKLSYINFYKAITFE